MTDQLGRASRNQVRGALKELSVRYRGRIVGIVLLFSLAAALALVPPRLIGNLIDQVVASASFSTVIAMALLMVLALLLQASSSFIATYASNTLAEDVFTDVRKQFVRDLLDVPISTVERAGTGELVARTSHDINAISATVRRALPECLVALLSILFAAIAAAIISPLVAVPLLPVIPILFFSYRSISHRSAKIYDGISKTYGPMITSLTETARSGLTIEALGTARSRDNSLDQAISSHWRAVVRQLRFRAIFLPWANLMFAFPLLGVLAWGGFLVIQNRVTVGEVATIALYTVSLAAPLQIIVMWIDEIQQGMNSFARVLGVSAAAETNAYAPAPTSHDIVVSNASYSYYGGHEVLHDLSLHIAFGERIAIVGPSGAGKSTFARLLAGLDEPTSGKVLVGNVEVSALAPAHRTAEVLLVSQEQHVFSGTLRENLCIAAPTATDFDIRAALSAIGASSWFASLPDGLDTRLGPTHRELETVHTQLVSLARIVLANPRILVLDEATSALAAADARAIERGIGSLLEDRTVISIAHRLHTARAADRIAVIDDGRLVELGNHHDLLESKGPYARLWALWSTDPASPAEAPDYEDPRDPVII